MAKTPRKEVVPRCRTTGALDQLQQVHELNRAFLGLLQSRLRAAPLVPRAAGRRPPRVGGGRRPLLEGVAVVPARAVSRATSVARVAACATRRRDFDEAEHDLVLLDPVRGAADEPPQRLSRAVAFRPRGAPTSSGFARSPLADLQQLACAPGVAALRVPRAALVLAAAFHRHAARAAPAAHADGAAALHRQRLAAAPARRSRRPDGDVLCRARASRPLQ